MRKMSPLFLIFIGLFAVIASAQSRTEIPWQQVVIGDHEFALIPRFLQTIEDEQAAAHFLVWVPGDSDACRAIGSKSGCYLIVFRRNQNRTTTDPEKNRDS